MIPLPSYTTSHVKAITPTLGFGYLAGDDHGGLILYDRESPDRSPHEMYLYHFSSDKIINHFKHSVRMHLRPLHEHEKRQFEKVKEACLEYKQRYFRHLIRLRETGFRHAIPTDFLSLSYSKGGRPWESFNGDPGWKFIRQEKKLWQDKNLN